VHKLLDLSGGAHFRFFSEMSYQLWGDMYSLNDLQHGLLRSGTPPPPCIPSLPRARIPRIPAFLRPMIFLFFFFFKQ
jgi:hypothetical protein